MGCGAGGDCKAGSQHACERVQPACTGAGARGVQTAHRGQQPGPGVPPDEILIRIARAVDADGTSAVTLQAQVTRWHSSVVSKRWSNSSASVKMGTNAADGQGAADE